MTVTPDPRNVTGDAQSATPAQENATSAPADVAADALRRVAAARGATPEELVETLRDVATAHARDASLCDWCEGPIPEERLQSRARYCSENHRKEASRHRIARRRMFAERAADGETEGSCDVCRRPCHIENALCDDCFDVLSDQERDARDASPNDVDPGA